MTERLRPVRIGVVGGGMMGRELAAAIGRWSMLEDPIVAPRLVAVADPNEAARSWFERISTVETVTDDYRRLLDDDRIDVLYIAVPHNLHEEVFVAAARSGKDFLGEKPFGFDVDSCARIVAAIDATDVFVRCSSEWPFHPGLHGAFRAVRDDDLGTLIEVRAALLHSSDLDRTKPINWKRRVSFCGPAGVMGDLGMHAMHLPVRLGFAITSVYAVLQDLVTERPGPDGQPVRCDTWDNATLLCRADAGDGAFPLTLETKRIVPGESDTVIFEALGMDGGVRFTTRDPAWLHRFDARAGRGWSREHLGTQSVFPTVTPKIWQFGTADAIVQMWAAFFAEREGREVPFGCATPREALRMHELFTAALRSQATGAAVAPEPAPVPIRA